MPSSSNPRRPLGPVAYVATIIGVMAIGAVAGVVTMVIGDRPGLTGTLLTGGFMLAAMALALGACIWWWRGIDEAAREAHKWAWWWGGSSGMALGSAALVTLSLRADHVALPAGFGSSPEDLFASGVMAILLFQLVGYALAWAGWWLKHR